VPVPILAPETEPPALAAPAQTALHRQLARDIAAHIRSLGLAPGEALSQPALAKRFSVSRTPVRAALQQLAAQGIVALQPRGVIVADPAAALPAAPDREAKAEHDPEDALIQALSRDWHHGVLAADMTEASLMRRYQAGRAEVSAALKRLADLGLAMRKPGFGWRFVAPADGRDARPASYRFRLAVEPAALLEPGYRIDPDWLDDMRRRHRRYLTTPWREGLSVAFFDMNAAFHTGLVSASGNRFFIQAVEQQNSLRRLRNYSWGLGAERVRVSCEEHIAIMDALGTGDLPLASQRLAEHLRATALMTVAGGGPA
jgi:DNA-binding GntR family transcriptional regulator